MSNFYADEEVGHGLLSESASARYELDSSRSLSAEPTGVKRTVGLVLESPCFWVFVVMLIMLDLAMFAWQVIYDDDSRLHIYEFMIACFFIVELFLRVFAFETKHLFKSCVQLFDSCIVIVAFSLSVFAISTPILAARSARILLLLRGGSRVARAVTRTRRQASRGERERRDGVEMQGLSHLPKDAVAKKLEPTIPAYIKLTDPLRAAIDSVLADPDLPQADREALVNSRFGYYDAQENHSIAATSASALRVLSARLRATEGEGAPRLCDLLRGSSLVFPIKKL